MAKMSQILNIIYIYNTLLLTKSQCYGKLLYQLKFIHNYYLSLVIITDTLSPPLGVPSCVRSYCFDPSCPLSEISHLLWRPRRQNSRFVQARSPPTSLFIY